LGLFWSLGAVGNEGLPRLGFVEAGADLDCHGAYMGAGRGLFQQDLLSAECQQRLSEQHGSPSQLRNEDWSL
jgi:hypothetical protein